MQALRVQQCVYSFPIVVFEKSARVSPKPPESFPLMSQILMKHQPEKLFFVHDDIHTYVPRLNTWKWRASVFIPEGYLTNLIHSMPITIVRCHACLACGSASIASSTRTRDFSTRTSTYVCVLQAFITRKPARSSIGSAIPSGRGGKTRPTCSASPRTQALPGTR